VKQRIHDRLQITACDFLGHSIGHRRNPLSLRSAKNFGGLISYGIDSPDLWRRAAFYVDRILKGEKPADLPVQMPIKFEMVINLKTAKALGLHIPPTLLATAMAADLVRRQVAVIVGNTAASLAAKMATTTIPIVFDTPGNPVELGLVASLNRPCGNITSVTNLNVEVGPKRLELLHEAVPVASEIAVLLNPTSPNSEPLLRDLQSAGHTLRLQIRPLSASTAHEIEAASVSLVQLRASALVIGPDPFFNSQVEQLAVLTVQHAVPAIYQYREFVVAGGLVSYGGSITDAYRLVGLYAGRILKGERPADLPVQQSTKVELIVNLKTAGALDLTVPPTLLATADEVIE
jgi:putative tryptophan/tyrosine transport system substrate-binding protein